MLLNTLFSSERPTLSLPSFLKHIWKHPKGLLGRGLNAPPSIPLNPGIVEGHLLCASEEFPLCGNHAVTELLNGVSARFQHIDSDLFGGESVYNESLENLCDTQQVQTEKVNDMVKFDTFSKHPVSSLSPLRI